MPFDDRGDAARRKQVGEVIILPMKEFLNNLWNGEYSQPNVIATGTCLQH